LTGTRKGLRVIITTRKGGEGLNLREEEGENWDDGSDCSRKRHNDR